jgi:hypothetical protein
MALTVAVAVGFEAPAALANTCPLLYERCQEAIKQSKADAAMKRQVSKMCEEGIGLHKSGKHKESVEKLNEALGLIEKK